MEAVNEQNKAVMDSG